MDERGRLQCLPRLLVCEPVRGQLPQLVIDEYQQLARAMGIVRGEARVLAHWLGTSAG